MNLKNMNALKPNSLIETDEQNQIVSFKILKLKQKIKFKFKLKKNN